MKNLLLLLFLFSFYLANAQYNETLRGARPGNVIGAFTVGKGVLQLHQGVDFLQAERIMDYMPPSGIPFRGRNQLENIVFQNTIRFGLIEKLEVSAVINYNWQNNYVEFDQTNDPGVVSGNSQINDFQNIDLGLRYNILDGTNRAKLVWGIQLRSNFYQWIIDDIVQGPDLKLVTSMARAFSKYHTLRLNFGTTVRELENSSLVYGLNYVFRPVPEFGVTLEYSGELNNLAFGPEIFTHRYLCGFQYLIHNDVQLDIRAGLTETEMALFRETYYFGAGIMWRVRTIKRAK